MNSVLVVDHSGRGHAFADLFTRTNPDVHVYYAPGCEAITTERVTSVPELSLSDVEGMIQFAIDRDVDFAFVANTAALAGGFVDAFRASGVPAIGPTEAASRLESSKSYMKQLASKYGIPVAENEWFDDRDAALGYARVLGRAVIKGDGLCAGNGTFICDTEEQMTVALDRLMVKREFGAAGDRVVVEEKLDGREVLFFSLTDGDDFKMFPCAVDYPHSDDLNSGVICGGMGAFSPSPLDTPHLRSMYSQQILAPLRDAIAGEGLDYSGVLYVGAMLDPEGRQLRLLEINVRMGEPEAEVILPRVESDFHGLSQAILGKHLHREADLSVNDRFYCDVVATQGRTRQVSKGKNKGWYKGYPYGRHGIGYPITGLERIDPQEATVFIGQARVHPEKGLVTDGGRCLHVVGHGATHQEAIDRAYRNIAHVQFEGMRYRTDIGRTLPWERATIERATSEVQHGSDGVSFFR